MFDKEMIAEILQQIFEATVKVLDRFEPIAHPDDFTASPAGMEKLDAICMQIIAIGESLKNIDKVTNFELLPQYPAIDWKGVKGMRDIISHHYLTPLLRYRCGRNFLYVQTSDTAAFRDNKKDDC